MQISEELGKWIMFGLVLVAMIALTVILLYGKGGDIFESIGKLLRFGR